MKERKAMKEISEKISGLYTEDKRLIYERVLNVAIFAAAIGLTFFISGLYENKFNAELLGGIMFLIALVINYYIIGNRLRVYSEIILNAEQRILSDASGEPKQPQEAPQKQEKVEPIAEPKKGIYSDIWEVYIAAIVLFFTIYPVARDYVEKPSTFSDVLSLAVKWWLYFVVFVVVAIVIILLFKRYFRPKV